MATTKTTTVTESGSEATTVTTTTMTTAAIRTAPAATTTEWTSAVTFVLNGKTVKLNAADVHPQMTLLEYLREHTRLTGTKASCTQGGCGACNVMLTQVKDGKPSYSSVNACLRPVLSVDGCGITTTEGIGGKKTGFHPIQERIAKCNGSQCGFCTPGHVMAMFSLLQDKGTRPDSGPLTLAEIEERFDGNICRCTGYRPIMTAFHTFADEAAPGDSHVIAGLEKFEFSKYDASQEPAISPALLELAASPAPLKVAGTGGKLWFRPVTTAQLAEVKTEHPEAKLVFGHTSQGVYGADGASDVFVDISMVPEVIQASAAADGAVTLPATTTVTEMIRKLEANATKSASFPEMAAHFKKVASWQVRNVGSVAGNIMMARGHFMSDLATVLMGAGASIKFTLFSSGASFEAALSDFLAKRGVAAAADADVLVTAIVVPFLGANETYRSFRQAKRSNNAHALVNAALRATVEGGVITSASFAFGCIDHVAVFAAEAEKAVVGKQVGDLAAVAAALDALSGMAVLPEKEYITIRDPDGMTAYRRGLMRSFLFKFFVSLAGEAVPVPARSAAVPYVPAVTSGTQMFKTELPEDHPGKKPTTKQEAQEQAAGNVRFVDDYPSSADMLYGALVMSTEAPAIVTGLDASAALAMPGVVDFVTAADIPGFNCASPFGPGEELLFPNIYIAPAAGATDEAIAAAKAGSTLIFKGQPVGLIVAKSRREAEAACPAVKVTYSFDGVAKGVYTLKDAIAAGRAAPPTVNIRGDVAAEFAKPGMTVVEGAFTIGGQSHFCMEKHAAMSVPEERGHIQLNCGTQGIELVRLFTAAVLGKAGIEVEVNCRRMGGAFGAKFTKNMYVILASAVAANKLDVAVKIVNSIEVDMVMSGHCRHPFEISYKAAVDPVTKKIAAVEWNAIQDKGCSTDFSPFVGSEILNHAECLYHIPNFKVSLTAVNTDTPSNTAVRGPGIPQAHAMGETAIEHMATAIGVDIEEFREHNLLTEDAVTMAVMETPAGQIQTGIPLKMCNYTIPRIITELKASSDIDARKTAIAAFNAENKWVKRGIALMPMRYSHMPGLNAGTTCTIHISGPDGAVNVHHGGVEMGQGLNTKVAQIIATTLGCSLDSIYVHAAQTATTSNAGIIGGSVGSETCAAAAYKAAKILVGRMAPVNKVLIEEKEAAAKAAGKTAEAPSFKELVAKCTGGLMEGFKVCLTAASSYQAKEGLPPGSEPEEPWENSPYPQGGYLTFGAAVAETEIDVLTGDVRVLRADVLYDCGHSTSPLIDIGQAEGAFVFGQGFFLGEQIDMSPEGETLTKGTWEYKPTLATNMPREFNVEFLKDSPFPFTVKGGKPVGEPPLVAAYSLFSATKNAISASRVERGLSPCVNLNIPATCDTVYAALELSPEDLVASLQ